MGQWTVKCSKCGEQWELGPNGRSFTVFDGKNYCENCWGQKSIDLTNEIAKKSSDLAQEIAEKQANKPSPPPEKKAVDPKLLKKNLNRMLSLAAMKREKNFIAQDKGYPRIPEEKQTLDEMFVHLESEMIELRDALDKNDNLNAREELADISNIVDYMYEILLWRRCHD